MSDLAPIAGTLLDGRFELWDMLGSGSFGEVYRAFDRAEARLVALKRLHRADPMSLARFKQEFRTVAGVHHESLVRLHGLFRDGDRWFFTMELVAGPDLVTWVRPEGALREDRIGPAFAQLARALATLHASGHVHRDVKPSNVRVDEGRVVLLDFGLSLALEEGSLSEGLVGSPRYMSPEQTEGRRASPASDAYAVGAMLYEALTGRPPFDGRPLEVLVRKRLEPAPPMPVDALGGRPASALDEWTMALLERDPQRRPRLEPLAAALEGLVGDEEPSYDAPPWVGRSAELEMLHAGLARVEAGEAVTVWIEGEPGVGKSSLARRFVRGLPEETLVLSGRCFEQESVPYEGIDGAVDLLAARLRASPELLDGFSSAGIPSLLTLFPVLAQVPSFGALAQSVGYERAQLRVEAFDALRRLLVHVASRRRLVVVVDDLQWGDKDGAALLADLLRPPEPVPMLFVGVLRAPAFERVPWVCALRARGGEVLPLGALDEGDATDLVRALQRDATGAAGIVEASGGNPFLIEVLVRHGHERFDGLRGAVARLLEELSPESRRLLEVVCLAGLPIARRVAMKVADVSDEQGSALATLRAGQLVSFGRGIGEDRTLLEPYHDRIREAAVARIDADARRVLHGKIGVALVEAGAEPESIAHHFDRAGEVWRAAEWSVRGARRAEAALAWDAAARLYRRALALVESEAARVGPVVDEVDREALAPARLEVALGDALGHAGRGIEAAASFRRALAAGGTHESDPFDLRRRIAEQLLRCGRMEEGIAALDEALVPVGLRYPRRVEAALGSLLASRARLWLRGTRFQAKAEAAIAPAALRRIDLCWSAGIGLGFVDSIRGSSFLTRSLLEALDAGDPYRIARSMAYEASYQANQGVAGEPRARALIRATAAIAEELDDPHLHALVSGAGCLVEFHTGRWRRSLERADEAVRAFREHSVGMVKEIATIQLLGTTALTFLGDQAELARRHPPMLRSAEARGDIFSVTSFRTGFLNVAWLAADDPSRAKTEAEAAMREWRIEGYVIQNFFDLWARTQAELYEGDGVAAHARVSAGWTMFRRSLLARIQFLRVTAHDLAGRSALATGQLRAVEVHEKALRKEDVGWAHALGASLEAGRLARLGRRELAEARYAEAVVRFGALEMAGHAAAATVARGGVAGGARGGRLVDEGLSALASLGVSAPKRWARMLCPAVERG